MICLYEYLRLSSDLLMDYTAAFSSSHSLAFVAWPASDDLNHSTNLSTVEKECLGFGLARVIVGHAIRNCFLRSHLLMSNQSVYNIASDT